MTPFWNGHYGSVLTRKMNERNGLQRFRSYSACNDERIVFMGNYVDLRGQRFGQLTVIEATDKRSNKGSVIWECICDCRKTVHVASGDLVSGNTASCGCRKRENQSLIGSYLTFVDGTCVEWLRSRKHRSDNTSGFRGVYKRPNDRYVACIGFKGKRYHCGTYSSFEEAKSARLEAEKIIHERFVDEWDRWSSKASQDSTWAEKNPFVYDVIQTESGFEVILNTF